MGEQPEQACSILSPSPAGIAWTNCSDSSWDKECPSSSTPSNVPKSLGSRGWAREALFMTMRAFNFPALFLAQFPHEENINSLWWQFHALFPTFPMEALSQWAEVPCADVPLSDRPTNKERSPQELMGLSMPWYWRLILWAPKRRLLTVYYLCLWFLSLRDFRNHLWALRTQTGLLHCLCCQIHLWWRLFFKGHQTFMGSTLPRDSRLFFCSVIYLFFQPRAAHNLYCALLSFLAAVSCLQKQWESGTWA